MQFIMTLLDFVLHLDAHLRVFADSYGIWVYLLLFIIIFCETGLVVTPFLPGDSILFMIGTLSAAGILNLWLVAGLLIAAAVIGDTVNYHIGEIIGPKAFHSQGGKFFKKENLEKAHAFYVKWGGLAIFLGRFMPIIRTFVPFAAGIGKMPYFKFLAYNAVGGIVWVSLFIGAGYLFGDIPVVEKNLTLVMFGVVVVSMIPVVVGFLKARNSKPAGA